jgi:hypothetical protein
LLFSFLYGFCGFGDKKSLSYGNMLDKQKKNKLMHFFVDIVLYVVVIKFSAYNIWYLFSLERRKGYGYAKATRAQD